MAQRGIREFDAKRLLARFMPDYMPDFNYKGEVVLVGHDTDFDRLADQNPWLLDRKLVVKPDQLFGKRGLHGLVLLNVDFEQARKFIGSKMNSEVVIGGVSGRLDHFLIEPYIPHKEEYYVAIRASNDYDIIYFSTQGGISVESRWDQVIEIPVHVLQGLDGIDLKKAVADKAELRADQVASFLEALYRFYVDLGFTYLEINPFTLCDGSIVPLDLVAKLDDAEAYWQKKTWGDLEFPEPFGRALSREELYIKELDARTGASLKLTILNPSGRVWTMIAGGGASVIYTDTICDLGHSSELCNYGEYSGDPNTEDTYRYTCTILDLMTRSRHPQGKILLIGGAIANFTDVASTFKGIVMAIKEYQARLKEHGIKIYVRRGGPNYEEGLRLMRSLGEELGIPIDVYGPETHMTRIVPLALEKA
ncbi:MAG TPA: ATP citrate lyase citrate-binding domain-containing protein [Methanotrichaceae archaeon]|nr:ATP citrate lyase citrate-binding domain-containing protein [Methanotrichaceae archaeon]HQF15608.1 ATP citrate lyase citrate-binding domain-containing protein [Methanotrichaceae archaeon]HQI90344.1 ATP citrate lyase citrate-binding domain-containing protein [Methanotrichaceae archaeon]HQJ28586.1 ATP citrate lyase citrate-binding domain-containing protein [Methanotrichaceae archaeon]